MAQFRVVPVNELVVPFMTAFAKAVARMPSLKEAALWSPLKFQPDALGGRYSSLDETSLEGILHGKLAWGMVYTKPDTPHKLYSALGLECSRARQMWWRVAGWRPDSQLHQLYKDIRRTAHGDELLKYWSDSDGPECLIDRGAFEGFTYDSFR